MSYSFSIFLKDFASNKLSKISSGLDKFQSKVAFTQTKVQNKFGKTTMSIDFLNGKLEKLNRQKTASTSVRDIMKLNTQIYKTERHLRKLNNLPPLSFVQRMRQATGALSGYIGVASGLYLVRDSFRKMDEQMQAVGQVQAGLASTNGKVGYSLEQLKKKAEVFQSKTIFGDEAILQNTTAQLLTFTNITGEAFDGTQQAVLDVTSRLKGTKASGEDLRANAILLGKALNDPVSNLGALSRNGIQFSDTQKEVIKNLAKTGKLAQAQSLILKELNNQYGGSAEKAAKTGLGGVKQFTNSLGDLQESLSSGLLPILNAVINPLKSVANWLNKNGETIKAVTPYVLGFSASLWAAKKIMLGYRTSLMLVSVATKIWTGVQAVFNATMWANPITWVVSGVIALTGAIAYVTYKTSGWGETWKNMMQYLRESSVVGFSFLGLQWLKLEDTFLTGFEKIKKGWYKVKSLWDEEGANKALANLQSNRDKRAEEIAKATKTLKALQDHRSKIKVWKVKWDDSKSLSDITKKLKEKLGFGQSAMPDGSSLANAGGGAFQTAGFNNIQSAGLDTNSPVSGVAQTIAGGGAKQTHINITIEKLQDDTKIYVQQVEDGIHDLGDKIQEMLLRAVNSVNQLQT